MRFDLYAELVSLQACPTTSAPGRLASGFVDCCTAFSARDGKPKNEARDCYRKHAAAGTLQLPSGLNLDPDLGTPLPAGWLSIEIKFKLLLPWYSKDDRPFHVLDNPVRKDRVFGVPYMSAASWKGLLRWACRMQAGLQEHLQRHGSKMDDWSDPDWIIHLFGNEKGETEDFLRGALVFYPTWFNKIGFEVINPHSRKTRAGTQPILYEVVPRDTEGVLRLLYAPLPDDDGLGDAERTDALQKLLDAAKQLLTVYGFSAKRTSGWGIAEVIAARANGGEWKQENPFQELKDELATLLSSEVDPR
ncbi:MAG: RAMP superfamily CRISPR-associated protein [Bryobacteraceae bacterium]|nr:RAMP superfamily CRISPR-associated protein [Bryobacteraceae bacterium]MDW8379093.1 RAMP superfamily CRISPR-associated protein [Bryobacterales bacterium]